MNHIRPLLLITALGLPVLAAPPLELHVGSTRDWVRRTGANADSVHYRLTFLDSAKSDTGVDWRVRVTIAESTAVSDTAVLRVFHAELPMDPAEPTIPFHVENLAIWTRPSAHFPIDVQYNPTDEVDAFQETVYESRLANGAWEFSLATLGGSLMSVWSSNGILSTNGRIISLAGYEYASAPSLTHRDSVGITSWLGSSGFWELEAADSKLLGTSKGRLGHPLRKGESWVYRDTSSINSGRGKSDGLVALELLDAPSDSATWLRLSVRRTIRPDSGRTSVTELPILIDTLHRLVRTPTDSGSPWQLPNSFEGLWALGLTDHPSGSQPSPSAYSLRSGSRHGEIPSTGGWISRSIVFTSTAGATTIAHSSGFWLYSPSSSFDSTRSWTLVAHSLDNSILGTVAKPAKPARDLAWLRTRIAQDPALEVVRIRLDGARTSARGPAALKLLQERGVGIVQVREGMELTTLRIARP